MKKLFIMSMGLWIVSTNCMEQATETIESLSKGIENISLENNSPSQQAESKAQASTLRAKIVDLVTIANKDKSPIRTIGFVKNASNYLQQAQQLQKQSPNNATNELTDYARKVFYAFYEQQVVALGDIQFGEYKEEDEEALIEELIKQLNTLLTEYYFTIVPDSTKTEKEKEHLMELLSIARQNAELEN